jgi:hypothetical protein
VVVASPIRASDPSQPSRRPELTDPELTDPSQPRRGRGTPTMNITLKITMKGKGLQEE